MAKFNGANEIVADENGNFYVSDFHNNVIRKISRTGMVTTITGTPGKSGSVDGAGSHAKFNGPTYMAADKAGNLFVWDSGNRVIRKISRAAVVTTLAGYVELKNGKNDGVGQSARFESVTGMTIDQLGNLFVTDGSFIRKVSPAGEVKTIGDFSEKLNDIWTAWPTDIAADGLGNLYFVLNETVRKLTPLGQTTILAGIPNRRGIELGSPGVLDRPHGLIVLDDETLALISGNAILKLKVH
jgi:sugar lactone lactonase YvrE